MTVELPVGPYNTGESGESRTRLASAFEAAYLEKYQRTPVDVPIEFLNVRVTAQVEIDGGEMSRIADVHSDSSAVKGVRSVYFHEARDFIDTTVMNRSRLRVGELHDGPAVLEDEGSTLIVGPDAQYRQLPSGNVEVLLGAAVADANTAASDAVDV